MHVWGCYEWIVLIFLMVRLNVLVDELRVDGQC